MAFLSIDGGKPATMERPVSRQSTRSSIRPSSAYSNRAKTPAQPVPSKQFDMPPNPLPPVQAKPARPASAASSRPSSRGSIASSFRQPSPSRNRRPMSAGRSTLSSAYSCSSYCSSITSCSSQSGSTIRARSRSPVKYIDRDTDSRLRALEETLAQEREARENAEKELENVKSKHENESLRERLAKAEEQLSVLSSSLLGGTDKLAVVSPNGVSILGSPSRSSPIGSLPPRPSTSISSLSRSQSSKSFRTRQHTDHNGMVIMSVPGDQAGTPLKWDDYSEEEELLNDLNLDNNNGRPKTASSHGSSFRDSIRSNASSQQFRSTRQSDKLSVASAGGSATPKSSRPPTVRSLRSLSQANSEAGGGGMDSNRSGLASSRSSRTAVTVVSNSNSHVSAVC